MAPPMIPVMPWQAILEHDPETGDVTGTVVGLPDVIAGGKSDQEVLDLLREGIAYYLDDAKEAGIEVPARPPVATLVPLEA